RAFGLLRGVDVIRLAAFAEIGRPGSRTGRVAAKRRGAVDGGAGDVAGGHQLAHLVGRDNARGAIHAFAVARGGEFRARAAAAIQRGTAGVQGCAVDEPGDAGALAGGLRGARGGGDREVDARAEVRAAVDLQIGGRLVRDGYAVQVRRPLDRVDDERVRQRARLVVVLGGLIRSRCDHDHAVLEGIADR